MDYVLLNDDWAVKVSGIIDVVWLWGRSILVLFIVIESSSDIARLVELWSRKGGV